MDGTPAGSSMWTTRTILLSTLCVVLVFVCVVVFVLACVYFRRYRKQVEKFRQAEMHFDAQTYDVMLRTYADVCDQERLGVVEAERFCQCQHPTFKLQPETAASRPPSLSPTQSDSVLVTDRTQTER